MFTFQCTRCRKKPAIVTRGRKVFLCPDCATGSLMHDMVGSLIDPGAAPGGPDADNDAPVDEPERQAVEQSVAEGPTDPWGAAG